jgi:hypothetical protein
VSSVEFTERLDVQQPVHASVDCPGVAQFAGVSVNDSALHATIRVRLDTTLLGEHLEANAAGC